MQISDLRDLKYGHKQKMSAFIIAACLNQQKILAFFLVFFIKIGFFAGIRKKCNENF